MSTDQRDLDSQSRDLRKRLMLRIGVAGLLLVGALVGFQWLEGAQQRGSQELVPAQTQQPRPAAAAGSTSLQAPAPAIAAPPNGQTPTLVDSASAPGAALPMAAAAVGAAEQGSGLSPAPSAVNAARPEPESPPEPKVAPGKSAVPGVPGVPSATKNKIPRGPHLQAGVFVQAVNAEELKSKLEAQGLPVYIESRVQVGPFKDRKEAERMREELKAKGISTLLIAQ